MSIYAENGKQRELAGQMPARKKARVEIEWHRFHDGTSNHQPIIFTDGRRIPLAACATAAQAHAEGELFLVKHHLLPDRRSVEYDKAGNALIGRW